MDAEKLLKRIQALEEGQSALKRDVSRLLTTERRKPSPALQLPSSWPQHVGPTGLSPRHHRMILQSLGQSVHVLDLHGKIFYWNRYAEHLYGNSASEAIGQDITNLVINPREFGALNHIVGKIFMGKCWRGIFPVRNKHGDRFSVVADGTPFCTMTMVA